MTDNDGPHSWRKPVLAACRATGDHGLRLPRASCRKPEDWTFLVLECLASRLLWDDGYDMDGALLDLGPGQTEGLRRHMNIYNYYTDIAPDPTEEKLEAVRRTMQELCDRKRHRGP